MVYYTILALLLQLSLCAYAENPEERIIGGAECGPEDRSNTIVLITIEFPQTHCSGTIITPYHILTAAHCASRKPMQVFAGVARQDLSKMKEKDALNHSKVIEQHLHPKYNRKTFEYDIAVFEVSPKMSLDSSARGAVFSTSLPSSEISGSPDDWSNCSRDSYIMGWGQSIAQVNDSKEAKLWCARTPILSPDQCQSHYKELPVKDHICASHLTNKLACLGDSGGAIICNEEQVGVISFGGCHSGAVCKWGSKQRKGSMIRCGNGLPIPLHHRYCWRCPNYLHCRYLLFQCAFPKWCRKGWWCPGFQEIAGPPPDYGSRNLNSSAAITATTVAAATAGASSGGKFVGQGADEIKFGKYPTVGIRTDLNIDFIMRAVNLRAAAEPGLQLHVPCLILCTIFTTCGFNI